MVSEPYLYIKLEKYVSRLGGKKSNNDYLLTMHYCLTLYYVPGMDSLSNSVANLLWRYY